MAADAQTEDPGGYGGSVWLGILSFVVGGLLAVGTLMGQSVAEVGELPEAEDREPGMVYFVRGEVGGGNAYTQKLNLLRDGGVAEVVVHEEELNSWSRRELGMAEDGGSWLSRWLVAEVGTVQFRIDGDSLWMGTEVTLASWTGKKRIPVQVYGEMEANLRGEPRFKLERGHVGRAPLGLVPGIRSLVYRQVQSYYEGAEGWEQVAALWPGVKTVEVVGDEGLRFVLGSGG